jgi:hypothetical protein
VAAKVAKVDRSAVASHGAVDVARRVHGRTEELELDPMRWCVFDDQTEPHRVTVRTIKDERNLICTRGFFVNRNDVGDEGRDLVEDPRHRHLGQP